MELRSDRRHNYSVHLTYCVSAVYYLFIHIPHPPSVPLRLSIIGLVDHREPQHHKSQAVYSVAMETVLSVHLSVRLTRPCAPSEGEHADDKNLSHLSPLFLPFFLFFTLRFFPKVYADGNISTGRCD